MFWRSNCNIGIPSRFFRQAGLLSGRICKMKSRNYQSFTLTFRRQNFLLNFSTPCI
jgi:hypothetical protein